MRVVWYVWLTLSSSLLVSGSTRSCSHEIYLRNVSAKICCKRGPGRRSHAAGFVFVFSSRIDVSRYKDCGNGVIEYTTMRHSNVGSPYAADYHNVPWGSVRHSVLRDLVVGAAAEPVKDAHRTSGGVEHQLDLR